MWDGDGGYSPRSNLVEVVINSLAFAFETKVLYGTISLDCDLERVQMIKVKLQVVM